MVTQYVEILIAISLVTNFGMANSSLLFDAIRSINNMQQTISRDIITNSEYEKSYILSIIHDD